jgi:hypothetical protein
MWERLEEVATLGHEALGPVLSTRLYSGDHAPLQLLDYTAVASGDLCGARTVRVVFGVVAHPARQLYRALWSATLQPILRHVFR